MPRIIEDRIKGRDFSTESKQTAQLQAVASPVNTYVQPGKDPMFGLVDALSSLNPALKAYQEERDKKDVDVGRMMALRGQELAGSENDNVVRGYRELKFGEKGRLASADLRTTVADLLDDEEFLANNADDPQGAILNLIKSRIAQDTEGETDPTMVKAYAAQVLPLMEELPFKYAEHQRKRVEDETDQMLNVRTRDMIANITNPEELRVAASNEIATWTAMGKSRKEFTNSFIDSLVVQAREAKDPELLNVAYIPGADNHVMTSDPDVADKITKARAEVTKLQHDDIKEGMLPEWIAQRAVWEETMNSNPYDPSLNTEELIKHSGKYGVLGQSASALQEMISKVDSARKAYTKAEASNTYIMPDRKQWAIYSRDSDFKKAYDQETYRVIESIQFDNPQSVITGFTQLKEMHQDATIPSDAMVGLFSAFKTMTVDPETGEVPPALMLAYQGYKFYMASKNAGLLNSLMDDDSRAIAFKLSQRMKDRAVTPLSLGEAIEAINLNRSPDKAVDVDELKKDAKLTQLVNESVADEMEGGWFSDGLNERGLREASRIVHERAIDLASNQQMNKEDAVELALMEAKGRILPDGHGTFIQVPKDVDPMSLQEATKEYLAEYKRKNDPNGSFHLELNEDGKTYTLKDLGRYGLPIVENIPVTTILGATRPITYGSDENRLKMTKLAFDFKQALSKDKAALDKLVDENYGELNVLMKGDTFSTLEKLKIKAFLEYKGAIQGKEVRDAVERIQAANKNFLAPKMAFLDGKTTLSTSMPAHRVEGTPSNVTELAAYWYDKSPVAAMLMEAEGLRLNPYKDNKGTAIGFGFNLNGRSEKEVKTILRKAGVPEAHVPYILKGEKVPGKAYAMTPEQAVNLLHRSIEPYEAKAKEVYGFGWDGLPPHVKAVMVGIAYNSGNLAEHRKTLALLKEEKYEEAAKELSIKYYNPKTGKKEPNTRLVQIWREMMSGQYGNILKKKVEQTKRK